MDKCCFVECNSGHCGGKLSCWCSVPTSLGTRENCGRRKRQAEREPENAYSCSCHSKSNLMLQPFRFRPHAAVTQTELNSVQLLPCLSECLSSTEVHHGNQSLHPWKGTKSLDGSDWQKYHIHLPVRTNGSSIWEGNVLFCAVLSDSSEHSGDSGRGTGNAFEPVVTSLPLVGGRHMPGFFI